MKNSFFQNIKYKISKFKQWFVNTPERALLEAYKAAQVIRNIEIEHFGNQRISASTGNYTENVMSYWQGYLNKNLIFIKVKLAEFRLSRSVLNISEAAILEQLQFIDDVISKYNIPTEQISTIQDISNVTPIPINNPVNKKVKISDNNIANVPPVTQKTGFLPRSLGRTINRIQADLSPQAEADFIRNYHITQRRTRIALRFFLILILVPLLTQHIFKQVLFSPLVEKFRGETSEHIFLNVNMEIKALEELKSFEHKLKFENLLYESPKFSHEEVQEQLREKAIEIAEEFTQESNSAISNVFADLLSLVAFGIIVAMSKKEIVIVKSFIDNIVYGLSDSAKAFLIILFTDIFVGFHSPHGWEVLLEGLSEHLGIPANRSAIFLFIATFPVILDTIFKYWIFRYLSRLSPSALATLKEMDE
ncbi:proton extrusion protein PcxA [Calothrix sp. FACHB-1219]|uniref:proton extrusion protein PcxA n=1 Tax=unclassified Calothrix TaxID=2619626 RepID=UPI0016883C98|nr:MULTISPECIES: proton extrusion protein PcxA [unclassified Calothrix]MBD2204127.1 proton extrusion protein PcxA [Calothrix sp. FACHB-168]MBD2220941.1 proton extrusion protein PcxA [Calothrix sp. FACHB-1219]